MDVIDELIAHCEAWEPWARVMGNVCAGDAAQALRSLRAELASYKQDAERYRWLRENCKPEEVESDDDWWTDYKEVSFTWQFREWVDGKPVIITPLWTMPSTQPARARRRNERPNTQTIPLRWRYRVHRRNDCGIWNGCREDVCPNSGL